VNRLVSQFDSGRSPHLVVGEYVCKGSNSYGYAGPSLRVSTRRLELLSRIEVEGRVWALAM